MGQSYELEIVSKIILDDSPEDLIVVGIEGQELNNSSSDGEIAMELSLSMEMSEVDYRE